MVTEISGKKGRRGKFARKVKESIRREFKA